MIEVFPEGICCDEARNEHLSARRMGMAHGVDEFPRDGTTSYGVDGETVVGVDDKPKLLRYRAVDELLRRRKISGWRWKVDIRRTGTRRSRERRGRSSSERRSRCSGQRNLGSRLSGGGVVEQAR
jgi:hypothetical protein